MEKDRLEEIYNTYFRDVYGYLYRLTGSAERASELTSETFFRALKAIDGFRGECSLRSWLCAIAKNALYSASEKEKRTKPVSETEESADVNSPSQEELAEDRDMAQRILAAAEELDEPYRSVFLHRTLAGTGFAELGAEQGKTANWACVVYHRAVERLRRRFGVKLN